MDDEEMKLVERKTRAENLTDHLSDYVETYVELGVVNATQKAAGVATVTLTAALLSFFCLFVLFFTGLGVAVWLGESWGDMKAGYFTVAGFSTKGTSPPAPLRGGEGGREVQDYDRGTSTKSCRVPLRNLIRLNYWGSSTNHFIFS